MLNLIATIHHNEHATLEMDPTSAEWAVVPQMPAKLALAGAEGLTSEETLAFAADLKNAASAVRRLNQLDEDAAQALARAWAIEEA